MSASVLVCRPKRRRSAQRGYCPAPCDVVRYSTPTYAGDEIDLAMQYAKDIVDVPV